MANKISRIKLPNGQIYNVVDEVSQEEIENLKHQTNDLVMAYTLSGKWIMNATKPTTYVKPYIGNEARVNFKVQGSWYDGIRVVEVETDYFILQILDHNSTYWRTMWRPNDSDTSWGGWAYRDFTFKNEKVPSWLYSFITENGVTEDGEYSENSRLDAIDELASIINAHETEIDQLEANKVNLSALTQNTGDSEDKFMSQKAVTDAIANLTMLPYGGSKDWLEGNGNPEQLYQIDGYVWGYIESTGWTRSATQFLIVSSESEMTNEGGAEYLLRNGDSGTVYKYTAASGDVGVTVVESVPEVANDGDIITVIPTVVSSVDEMTDTSKQYALDGKIWEYSEVYDTVNEQIFDASKKFNGHLSGQGINNSSTVTIYTMPLDISTIPEGTTATVRCVGLYDRIYGKENALPYLEKYGVSTLESPAVGSNQIILSAYGGSEYGVTSMSDGCAFMAGYVNGSIVDGYDAVKTLLIEVPVGQDMSSVAIYLQYSGNMAKWHDTGMSVGKKYKCTVETQEVPDYTNLAETVTTGYRLSSGGVLSAEEGATTVEDYIVCNVGEVFRIKGFGALDDYNLVFYRSQDTSLSANKPSSWTDGIGAYATYSYDSASAIATVTITESCGLMRVSGKLTGTADDVIITKNEEIATTMTTIVSWADIGSYIAPTEASWDATDETHDIIDSLSVSASGGDTAVFSEDGYLYSYIEGSAWMSMSKYTVPTLTIDSELSLTSMNAIQNRTVASEIDALKESTQDNTNEIHSINSRIAEIETGSTSVSVPSFWQDALNECIAKIKALQIGRNCVTFPFFSDNHQRNGYAGLLISEVMKQCHIPYCFFGGDSISNGYIDSEETMIAQDKAFDTSMSYIPNGRFCRAVGNHDGFWNVSSATGDEYHYTDAKIYELFLREESIAQNKHFGGDGTYYYVDDIASQVRWIVMDTNDGVVEEAQLMWLENVALSFNESGWAIVFISHQPISNHYHAGISNAADVRAILTDYMGSYGPNKADIVGWYSGHIHRDRIWTGAAVNTKDDSEGDPMGFTQVTITSDHTGIAYDDATKHTVAADDQSHAIDFVTINKGTRTVHLTRLGVGEDRSYTY